MVDTDDEDLMSGDCDSDEDPKDDPNMDEAAVERPGVHQRYVDGVLVETEGEDVDENETYSHLKATSRRVHAMNWLTDSLNRMVTSAIVRHVG